METETVPDVEIATPPPSNAGKTWLIASIAAVVALAAGVFGVKALDKSNGSTPTQAVATQSAGFGQRPTSGKIASISGSTFKVDATDFNGATSTVNVTTTKSTTYTESATGALSDLKVGDTVVANGTTTDGVVTATRVAQAALRLNRATTNANGSPPPGATDGTGNGRVFNRGGPAGGGGNFTAGDITSIKDGVLTLSSPDGSTVTVKTTSDTAFIVNKKIAFRDLKVGDTVRVMGVDTNGTVAAADITKGDQAGGFFRGGPGE